MSMSVIQFSASEVRTTVESVGIDVVLVLYWLGCTDCIPRSGLALVMQRHSLRRSSSLPEGSSSEMAEMRC